MIDLPHHSIEHYALLSSVDVLPPVDGILELEGSLRAVTRPGDRIQIIQPDGSLMGVAFDVDEGGVVRRSS